VFDRRRAGVLLHLTSLEAPLGRGGRAFIDWLAEAGFSVWQFLPLGPTGSDRSPYFARSDFAGNPALLDPAAPAGDAAERAAFEAATLPWLEDYAQFEAISARFASSPWWQWPAPLAGRERGALAAIRRECAAELERIRAAQFAFFVQWHRLRRYAHARGVRLFGDLPFYVGPMSAETWADRGQFQLDATGRPAAVAGVPPDYFSAGGQVWGNPLYDWSAMQRDGFAFWRARLGAQLARFDVLRIDHFRAFAAHWAVPAGARDARGGQWVPTPGRELLERLRAECGALPIVAEDLGLISADVTALRQDFALPGMRVLQFAFDGSPDNPHLPARIETDCVVYTGTHDNDTTLGWYLGLEEHTRRYVDRTLGVTRESMPEAMARAALATAGQLAVIPAQDLLGLGSAARLNTPGTQNAGNWRWQLPAGALTPQLAAHWRPIIGRCERA
jgi:4-alpha-glucanotransferase